jgi:RNA polymerase sigma factor (sigma-70 family)
VDTGPSARHRVGASEKNPTGSGALEPPQTTRVTPGGIRRPARLCFIGTSGANVPSLRGETPVDASGEQGFRRETSEDRVCGKGAVVIESKIVGQLRGIASKLTGDAELQKDLIQEMFVHLVRVQSAEAGHTPSWYMKSCEFHARNHLKLGRSIDSVKRASNGVRFDDEPFDDGPSPGNGSEDQPAGPIQIQGEMITQDIVSQMLPRLSDRQQQVLSLLLKGCGVREAGRELGVSHVAIIKHRKKIARIAREFLGDPEPVGTDVPHRT